MQDYPVANVIEEITFNLAIGATRDGPVIDTKDWYKAEAAQFTDDRKSGWPLLDLAIRPPGNVNVILQLGVDIATFNDWLTTAAPANVWTTIRERLPGRFARVRVENTLGDVNNGIYLWSRLASQ